MTRFASYLVAPMILGAAFAAASLQGRTSAPGMTRSLNVSSSVLARIIVGEEVSLVAAGSGMLGGTGNPKPDKTSVAFGRGCGAGFG